MKRIIIATLGILIAGCLVIALGWVGFLSFLQSRVSPVTVSAAAGVDEVRIYNVSDPTRVVASVRPKGQDTTAEFSLPVAVKKISLFQPLPEQYFFLVIVGEQQYQGPKFCCIVSIIPEHRILTIRGLNNWEVRSE